MFTELFTEAKPKVNVAGIKAAINDIELDVLFPNAFEVDEFNTDAGMGGEKVIRVKPLSTRKKDQADVAKVKRVLSSWFDLTDKNGLWIIR